MRQYLRAGRHNGAWDGFGITSGAARFNPNHSTALGLLSGAEFKSLRGPAATFGGLPVADTDALVKYTWYGDSDLNGKVNFDDYVRIDQGFNNHLSGWLNGDFDYSGQVNFDDYVLIDLAFNTQSGTLGRALKLLDDSDRIDASDPALREVQQHMSSFGRDYANHFIAAVPEPSATVPLAGAMLLLLPSWRTRRACRQHS